jgi:hypothetical protein
VEGARAASGGGRALARRQGRELRDGLRRDGAAGLGRGHLVESPAAPLPEVPESSVMGHLYVTLNEGTDREVTLTFMQMCVIAELRMKLGKGATWHQNNCRCCVTVHPPGHHDRGYLVGEDGEYDWVGPEWIPPVWPVPPDD